LKSQQKSEEKLRKVVKKKNRHFKTFFRRKCEGEIKLNVDVRNEE
jgi:hypothetical protein